MRVLVLSVLVLNRHDRTTAFLPTPPALIDLCSVDVPDSADYIRDTTKRDLLLP